jgi:hypothetical protein
LERRLAYADLLKFDDPVILDLVKRVKVEGREDISFLCSRITVELADGAKCCRRMDVTEEFYNPDFLTDADLLRKMVDEMPIPADRIEALIDTVARLETMDRVDPLIRLAVIRQ